MTSPDQHTASDAVCIEAGAQLHDGSSRPVEETASDLLQLMPVMDLQAAAPLAKQFASRRGHFVVVNGRDVTRIGAQCAQVLVSAVVTWRQESIPLAFVECSEPMIDDLKTMGIEAFILNGSGRQ